MRVFVAGLLAAGLTMGTAVAEECTLDAEAPTMPDPATATAEERATTVQSILDYQAALGEYRACLDDVMKDKDLETDVRQAALDAYNSTVDDETAVVESWTAFDTAYQEANDG